MGRHGRRTVLAAAAALTLLALGGGAGRAIHQRADRRHQRRLLPARRRAGRRSIGKTIPDAKTVGAGDQGLGREPQPAAGGQGRDRLHARRLAVRRLEGQRGGRLQDAARQAARHRRRSIRTTSRSSPRTDSGIKTLADLKGKRLSVGAPKSGTELNARAILDGRRHHLQGSRQGRVPAVRRIGRADEEPPARRDAAVGRPRRLVDPRPRDLGDDRRRRDPGRRSSTKIGDRPTCRRRFPANTYEGQDAATCRPPRCRTSSSRTSGVSDDTRLRDDQGACSSNLDELAAAHAAAKAIKLENALEGHAGAAASRAPRSTIKREAALTEVSARGDAARAAGRSRGRRDARRVTGAAAPASAAAAATPSIAAVAHRCSRPSSSSPPPSARCRARSSRSVHVGFLLLLAVRLHRQPARRRARRSPLARLGARRRRLRARPLSLGLLGRPDPARRRSDHAGHRRRRHRGRAGVRGGAAR